MTAIPQIPQLAHARDGLFDARAVARFDDRLHFDRVRTVDDAEDVFTAHEPEARGRALQVVDGLTHVALGAEHERREAIVCILDLFRLGNLQQAPHDLGVREAGVAQDGAAGLQGLDDFVGHVAGEGEAGGGGVDFHGAAEGLLGARGHAVGFVEDDEFLAAGGEGDFFLGEAFDAVADDVDACMRESLVRGIAVGARGFGVPRSSLALSSRTASLYASPRSCLARHNIDVVLPIPGIPEIITCGMFPSLAIILRRSIVSELPTISSKYTGLYFSTLGAY